MRRASGFKLDFETSGDSILFLQKEMDEVLGFKLWEELDLTQEERWELSYYMIAQWQKFGQGKSLNSRLVRSVN